MKNMEMDVVNAREALARLRTGNRRFAEDVRSVSSLGGTARRLALVPKQSPFAVVLSCSDSRVPAEIVFDQGIGDLFVVRVAGNVVAPSLVGSIEFAVQTFGCELVVVMGHTACGAVHATLDAIRTPRPAPSENVLDIVQRIRPAIEPLVSAGDPTTLAERAIRANVRASADALRHGSSILGAKLAAGRLAIVGAEYSLASGVVDFFDAPEHVEGAPRALAASV